MAGPSAQRSLPLLRRTPQLSGAGSIPRPGAAALASDPQPTQPEEPDWRNGDESHRHMLAPDSANLSSLSREATGVMIQGKSPVR